MNIFSLKPSQVFPKIKNFIVTYEDPVPDPTETWGHFLKRVGTFDEPVLVSP